MGEILKELKDFEVTFVPHDENKDLIQLVSDVDIIIPAVSEIPEKVIDGAKKLRGIVQPGVGLDTVDIEAATKKNIPVVNEPEGSAIAMGELAMVLLLCTMKRILESRELMKKGIFFQPNSFEIAGKTLGVIGLGRSAKELIKRAKPFEMKIIGIDKYPEHVGDLGIDFIGGIEKLDYILENSDIVSLHCPANKETIGMINYEKICKMKNTAILINLARANIIKREDFIRAIKEKKISGAGLDVFWNEPMDPNDEILTLPSVFCTPHIATSTVEARLRIFGATGRNIQKVLNGEKPDSCVNL
jgi:D-3-phosphoglycerate dehydrogenase